MLIVWPRMQSILKDNPVEPKPVDATTVKPKNIDLAVVRGQFIELAMVLLAHLHGVRLIEVREEEPRVPPVKRRIIKAHVQPSFAHCGNVLGNEIAVGG